MRTVIIMPRPMPIMFSIWVPCSACRTRLAALVAQ